MSGKTLFDKYSVLITLCIRFAKCFPKKFRKMMLEHNRYKNGIIGIAIRYIWLASLAKSIGKNVSVFPMVLIKYPENLEIGDNVSIQSMCVIAAAGGIKIGNDVSIAYGTTVLSTTHTFEKCDTPIKYQTIESKTTTINNDNWIGCNVTIIGGCTIGEGSVIGANSTVTKNIPPFSVAVGSPAKVIKCRK
ncbi:MAG: acyltransferase [Treponema sp.]|nr:acyltransferase [Treponema sp.]